MILNWKLVFKFIYVSTNVWIYIFRAQKITTIIQNSIQSYLQTSLDRESQTALPFQSHRLWRCWGPSGTHRHRWRLLCRCYGTRSRWPRPQGHWTEWESHILALDSPNLRPSITTTHWQCVLLCAGGPNTASSPCPRGPGDPVDLGLLCDLLPRRHLVHKPFISTSGYLFEGSGG